MAQQTIIPIDDRDMWRGELFAGNLSGDFCQGPRRGSGVPGRMAFDDSGNAYVACGTFVYVITADGSVALLAGTPGTPGKSDGAASRACFGGANGVVIDRDGWPLISDGMYHCIKKVLRTDSGEWRVVTVAGIPGEEGHRDGAALDSLFRKIDAFTSDPEGALYVMDQDWLRKIDGGQVVTLNPEGGTGFYDGDLKKARFRRIMGAGPISCDPQGRIYIADRWGNVFRRADVAGGIVETIAGGPARGQPGFETVRPIDGEAMQVARFHSGGGPCGSTYEPVSGYIFVSAADEHHLRVITPDGYVKTFGPAKKGGALEGSLPEMARIGSPIGLDNRGGLYTASEGLMFRFHREPIPERAKSGKGKSAGRHMAVNTAAFNAPKPDSNRRLSEPPADDTRVTSGNELLLCSAGEYQVKPALVAADDECMALWQEGYSGIGSASGIAMRRIDKDGRLLDTLFLSGQGSMEDPAAAYARNNRRYLVVWQERRNGRQSYEIRGVLIDRAGRQSEAATIVSGTGNCLKPALASDGNGFLLIWHRLIDSPETGPGYDTVATILDESGVKTGPVIPLGDAKDAVALHDGGEYLVSYSRNLAVRARRINSEGECIGAEIKMGGIFEHRPSIAANGKTAAIAATRRERPNPWGWHGPGAFSIGRLTPDGRTPDRFGVDKDRLADGGFAGLIDRAQWKGRKGWPSGAPGGFKTTENGYWPYPQSSLCWDGKTWLAAWVRAKLDGRTMVGHEIFAVRIDPETMMPTSDPARVAGGPSEPGSRLQPKTAALGDGRILMVYTAAQPDGRALVAARLLSHGPLRGPARVEIMK